jgi:acetoin utilization deacetylase AcuC-like enzyme
MRFRLVYSKKYRVDIGDHVFPTSKYDRIKEQLLKNPPAGQIEFSEPTPAADAEILLAHTREYLKKIKEGTFTREEILRLELPYSRALASSAYLYCGGTILASRISLEDGLGIHIGGGFHHAFQDHGEGFCVLNDIAIAIKVLEKENLIKRALVVDCDLHQGNGTAAIFAGDTSVFTFSIHQENNYPFFKPPSSLDVGLRDRATDREYLAALNANIPKIISDFKPDFMVYVAGADPYKEDQIGGLSLTKDGLRRRDEFVFWQAINYQVPVCVVLAGGYAIREEDTVQIHHNTIVTGIKLFEGVKSDRLFTRNRERPKGEKQPHA